MKKQFVLLLLSTVILCSCKLVGIDDITSDVWRNTYDLVPLNSITEIAEGLAGRVQYRFDLREIEVTVTTSRYGAAMVQKHKAKYKIEDGRISMGDIEKAGTIVYQIERDVEGNYILSADGKPQWKLKRVY